jgi:Putative beta-barrel porin 2
VEVGYANSFFDYADRTPYSSPFAPAGAAARLNRIENMAHIDGRWNLQPETVGIIGYQFSWVDYTANLPIGFSLLTGNNILSDSRNNRSHYIYVGLEHSFRPDLSGSIKAGARFNDYYNVSGQKTSVSPYAQANLSYHYAPGSHVDLGVSHDRSSTYQFTVIQTSGDMTLDADATVAYLSLTHQIIPNLIGSVMGSYQYDTFNGGTINNENERFYSAGVNLEYRFNRHVSANVGYNYDRVEASTLQVNQFERNRAYIGATFVY